MKPLLEQILAMQDIIRGSEPEPTMIRCTYCGGSGESHSAYSDNCCPACDGVGKRPENWREMLEAGDED